LEEFWSNQEMNKSLSRKAGAIDLDELSRKTGLIVRPLDSVALDILFVGYSLQGKNKLLITVLATILLIDYVIVPAGALLALRLNLQRERQSRPAQTKVPALKGLTYENAETKLHASNLNIQLLATRTICHFRPD
jgi:hypothetical protein